MKIRLKHRIPVDVEAKLNKDDKVEVDNRQNEPGKIFGYWVTGADGKPYLVLDRECVVIEN